MGQSRFMEAMVVCKKGIKAHPDSVEAKLLLAAVYGRQKKYKRALTELDRLAEAKPDNAQVRLARGKVRAESGDVPGSNDDLKHAVDLAGELEEATAILLERGITYPEAPEPEPEPVAPQGNTDTADIPVHPAADGPAVGLHPRAAPSVAPAPAGSAVGAAPRYGSQIGPASTVPYQMRPQRLEGEEELEALARNVATEEPSRGRPKTTIALILVLLFVGTGLIGQRLWHKNKIENIDRLTSGAIPLFNRDTYGGYNQAAKMLEEIVEDYDAKHPLTLGRLAYAYAILWAEHGESDLKPKLDAILLRAEKHAPEVSHTVAARGLAALYTGKDRAAAARTAVGLVEPLVRRGKEGGAAPTHADLTLGIIELALGEYDGATKRLDHVKQVLPGSVRAKVWHARAAFRASRFGTSVNAYNAALRAEPQHPGAQAAVALARLRLGDLGGAAADLIKFDDIAKEHPKDVSRRDSALAEFARSDILRSAGEEIKAVGAYEQAVRLDPDNADFPYGLGRWLLENGRAKEAVVSLRKAAKLDPNRWAFQVELAEAEMHVNNYAAADALIEGLLKSQPDQAEVHLARARMLRRTKKPEAEAFLAEVLKKWPSARVDVHLELGRLYRAKDNKPKAKEELEKAIESMTRAPKSKQGDVFLSYGKLMDAMDSPELAIESYKQAGALGVMEGWYRVSIGYAKTNELRKAKKACTRYLAAGASLRYSKSARRLCESI